MYQQKKQVRLSQLRVGLTVTIALAIVFITVMFAGNIEEILKPKANVYAVFDDVKGLREGAPVWFSGIEIGSVKGLDFVMESKIKVTMALSRESLRYLKRDSKATILTLGLLGDKYIEIIPGSKTAPALSPGDTIQGVSPAGIQDIVETSQASLARLTEFIHKLEEILVNLEKGKGTVPMLLRDPALYENLKKTTEDLSSITKKLKSGSGTAGRLITEDKLYKDLSESVKEIRLFAETLNRAEGTVKKLIVSPELYDRFMKATDNLSSFTEHIRSSKGTLYRLIEDPELYNNLAETSKRLNSLLKRIDEGEGLLGSLIKDKEVMEELKITLKELNILIKDIRENPKKYFKFSLF